MATKQEINGVSKAAPKGAAAKTFAALPPCWVSKQIFSAPVTQVKQSTSTTGNLYWLNYNNTGLVTTLDFIVTFKPGSPINQQHHHFAFPGGGYGAGIATPFAVPSWGSNPILGPATLTVLANGLPAGSFNFTVVA
ncbi:MAG: hypothetical protein QOD32_2535 [Pyrinomonadaceae bacterium]|jgi:hypothetical protein|nr:hypothetical protein [Pyrinomonadaceae bacterium]MDX6270477.1 hypothetical protein [Acidobacteriota bacterium]